MALLTFSIPCTRSLSLLKSNMTGHAFRLYKRKLCTKVRHSKLQKFKKLDFEASTGVQNDVLLYSMDRGKTNKFYAFGSIFIGICCVNSAHLIYTTMKQLKTPVQADGRQPWYMWWEKFYVGNDFVPKTLALIILLTGVAVIWITNAHITHYIKSITLLRGGERVFIERYSFLGRISEVELPLKEVSAIAPKTPKDDYLIKFKGERLNYILDSKGTYHDIKLFNATVGVPRKLK